MLILSTAICAFEIFVSIEIRASVSACLEVFIILALASSNSFKADLYSVSALLTAICCVFILCWVAPDTSLFKLAFAISKLAIAFLQIYLSFYDLILLRFDFLLLYH